MIIMHGQSMLVTKVGGKIFDKSSILSLGNHIVIYLVIRECEHMSQIVSLVFQLLLIL